MYVGAGGEAPVRCHYRTVYPRTPLPTQRWTAEDIPKSDRLTLTISPSSGDVVGVGQPIVVRFDQSVKDRFAFEKQAVVTASVPLYGTWHWVNSREVHFRPEQYWPAH